MNRVLGLAVLSAAIAAAIHWQPASPGKSAGPGSATVGPQAGAVPSSSNVRQVSNGGRPPSLVGREVCKECHAENFHWHAVSGHAHTFSDASDRKIVETFLDASFTDDEAFGSFSYSLDENGQLQAHNSNHTTPFPLQYALGSGQHGLTLMTLVADPKEGGTMGIEHRVSWFHSDDSFGVTPSQEDEAPTTPLEQFGLPFRGKALDLCIDCHTTSATVVDQRLEDLVPNVNCEKCHGPGSEHVRQARASETPPPFSVGRTDWDTESEIRLCGSCHRMPIDVPLSLLRDYSDQLTRFQPVGMLRSECYLESEGKFKCSTCHNPHQSVKSKSTEDFVKDCIACHQSDSVEQTHCPVSTTEGCIGCHMPGVKLEHFTFHDHWIRVRDDD